MHSEGEGEKGRGEREREDEMVEGEREREKKMALNKVKYTWSSGRWALRKKLMVQLEEKRWFPQVTAHSGENLCISIM